MARKGFRKVKYVNTVRTHDTSNEVPVGEVKAVDLVYPNTPIKTEEAPETVKKESILTNLKNWINDGANSSTEEEEVKEEFTSPYGKEVTFDEVETHIAKITESATKQHQLGEKIMEDRTTVIAENVEITGDVKMKGNLEFYGKITGNLNSKGDINMANAAQIEGRVNGHNLTIAEGNIKGDLNIEKDANIGNQSRIVGDIHATTLTSSGIISGNIFISEKVILNATSVIEGNIQARELEVKVGAVIKGQIEIDTKNKFKTISE